MGELRFLRPEIKSDSVNFGTFFRGIECGPPSSKLAYSRSQHFAARGLSQTATGAKLRIELIEG